MTSAIPAVRAALPRGAFDDAAASYDAAFTDSALGVAVRDRVWRRLDAVFEAGDRVLELGCGTGADAAHLASRGVAVLATDASPGMLSVAQRRIEREGATDLVALERLDIGDAADLARLPGLGPFDGAFSDFGALNALDDRRALGAALGGAVRPGGSVAFVVMGPFCAWETAWHAAHREPAVATRRWRSGVPANVAGAPMRVWYPSPTTLRHELRPWFRLVELVGLGVVLPPTGLAGLVERRPRALRVLAAVDERLSEWRAASWFADHYVAVFERRST